MTQEQKAKAYDEAIEKAKDYYHLGDDKHKMAIDAKAVMEYIFPELKESEDERIRNEIIIYLKNILSNKKYGDKFIESWIAWLEKQGKNNMGISEATKQELEDSLHKALEKETPESCNEFLDNSAKTCKDEQKPTDKVEPKFHEGEWIIHQGTENIYQVVARIDNQYQLKYGDTYTVQKCSDVERCARLWDITKDAKDGDVLCCESGWTCIFKALDNHSNTFSSYCFMDSDKWFCNTGGEGHTLDKAFIKAYNGEIYPATKEQRDTLEKAMADAGYTFDFEKKELKKIEQKPAFEMITPEESLGVDSDTYNKIVDECIYGEKKPAWSEEDERNLNSCITKIEIDIQNWDGHGKTMIDVDKEIISWLKHLKYRVQPQTKQEWSEEDENTVASIISSLSNPQLYPPTIHDIEWLKSLLLRSIGNRVKSRLKHWKPNETEISILESIFSGKANPKDYQATLQSILVQLKAL